MALRLGKRRESPGDEVNAGRMPTSEDFTPRAINKAVFTETIQHPATILPFAIAVLGLIFTMVISLNSSILLISILCAFFSAASWVVNFFFRGEQLAEEHLMKLRTARKHFERDEVDSLLHECEYSGFREGAEAVQGIDGVFQKLNHKLQEQSENLTAQRFQILASDAYRDGLQVVRSALGVWKALGDVDADSIRDEIKKLKKKRGRLDEEEEKAQYESLSTMIDSNQKVLDLYTSREDSIHQLIAECVRIKAALESAHLQAADPSDIGNIEISGKGGISTELERAVNAAHKVEERLRSHGDTSEEDEMYRRAALEQKGGG